MQIRRMSALFGRLQGQSLEFQDGLNIIEAPNETGKSTWCAFLLSMLYGINSRERERAGFIPDKTRYAPWAGTAMNGRLDCRAGGCEITISRSTRRQTAPLGEFQAVYTGTGDSVPDLTGQTCGEMLTGVSKEVFERSAFIRQAGLSITQDAGLERRIASLITTGEEGTSYSEATDLLKKQLNRRRHNKTGQIPALEAELREIEQQQEAAGQFSQQLLSAKRQAESLATQEAELKQELAQHDLWESVLQQKALTEAETEAAKAERAAAALRQQLADDRIPENETIGRLRGALVNLETTRKNTEKARGEKDEAAKALLRTEAALNESPFVGQSPDSARKAASAVPEIRPRLWWIPLLAVPGALGIAYFTTQGNFPIAALASSLAGLISFLFMGLRESSDKKKRAAYLNSFGVATPEDLNSLLDTYLNLHEVHEAAQDELDRKSAEADTLYNMYSSNEQGILLEIRRFAPAAFDTSTADALLRECAVRRKAVVEAEATAQKARMRCEVLAQHAPGEINIPQTLTSPRRSKEEVTAELSKTQAALAAARSSADRLSGQLNAMGDPAVLISSAERLREELAELEGEYDAIRMAMDALDTANTTLQNRFSPELGRRAAEIFSQLTEGKYSGVVLDRTFRLSAEPTGDTLYRDAALLSSGTADQLYLATRLAICDLVLPGENRVPIILDDALANFDDARCAAALRWLKEEAKHRQILLFTCHSREAAFFADDEEVFIQRLTEST